MFENAGAKLKVLAKISFALYVIGGLIAGFGMLEDSDGASLLIIPACVLAGWLATIMLYAFAELCENVTRIAYKICRTDSHVNPIPEPLSVGVGSNGSPPPRERLFCPTCGRTLPTNADKCENCGRRI